MKRYTLVFLMSCIGTLSLAQNIDSDSLVWKVTKFYNASNNETVNHNCEFRTGQSSILWIQDNGEDVYNFRIISKEGSWSNVNAGGSIICTVTWEGLSGNITFRRQSGITRISMEFLSEGQNMMPYVFTVSEVVKI